jgi:hypothetical protein
MAATYALDVPDVGAFVFRRRDLRDELMISALADRLLGGDSDVSDITHNLAYVVAALKTLLVSGPDSWGDPLGADPTDPQTFRRINTVFAELRSAEERFRAERTAEPARPSTDPGTVT